MSGRKALGKRDAHHKRAHEARALRHAHGREVGRDQRVHAKVRARLRHGLLVDAHDGLGVLAARDLGHHAAKARVEVDLRGNDVGHDLAGAVDDGHGRLVAAALDGQDERTGTGDGGGLLVRARRGHDGPRAHGGVRVGRVVAAWRHERQLRLHDEGIVALAVVVGATADLPVAKLRVEPLGCGVVGIHLERRRGGSQHLRVVGDARE